MRGEYTMKKATAIVLALTLILISSVTYAATGWSTQASWSSTTLTTYFYTSQSTTKPSYASWVEMIVVDVGTCEFDNGEWARIGVTPVNTSNQVVGYGSGTLDDGPRTLALILYSNAPSSIKLKITNNENGVNIKSSGTWSGEYSY